VDPLIFLSYSSRDKLVADAICSRLENQGIRCWIAPRDVNPGADYSDRISDALESSTAMVMVFSSGSNASRHVKSEIDRAFSLDKVIIPFRVENVEMDKGLAYYLSKTHWLDALTKPLDQHIDRLAATIRKVSGLDMPPPPPPSPPRAPVQAAVAAPQSSASKAPWIIAGIAVVVCGFLLAAGLLFVWLNRTKPESVAISVSPTPTAPTKKDSGPPAAPVDAVPSPDNQPAPPPPDRDPFVGTWKIADATTIEGVPYDGTVEITNAGPRYKVKWNLAANVMKGFALPVGNKLCVAYSGEDFSVVVYKIGADGSLKGRWAYVSFSKNDRDGLENVTGGTPGKIEGLHSVKGLNPDGTSYEGSLTIKKTGQTYQLQWEILGRSIKGIAIKVDDALFAASAYDGTLGVVSYTFDGSAAKGVWTTDGESKLGTENLTK
jgi:TIR domain-containing protein